MAFVSEYRKSMGFIVLVDFVPAQSNPDPHCVLSDDAVGAVAWFGVITSDQDAVDELVRVCLRENGLHVLEINDRLEFDELEEVEEVDTHLASNIRIRPPDDHPVVWGTLHCYIAEGEA